MNQATHMPWRRRLAGWGALAFLLCAPSLSGPCPPVARATGTQPPLPQETSCSLFNLVEELRVALKQGSPAYRAYLKGLIREAALQVPLGELRASFDSEHEPPLIEALAAALATRMSHEGSPALIRQVVERGQKDRDKAARAAAIAGLRGTGSVEAMHQTGIASYEQLARDADPEVQRAIVDNLLEESRKVYGGHDRAVAEMAVHVAAGVGADPRLAARLLSEMSMEAVGHIATEELAALLLSEHSEVRAAAAIALGGVSATEAGWAEARLLAHYSREPDREVRAAVLEGLAHLGFARAIPSLQSLRPIDPWLGPEIDAWTAALRLGLQEWSLIRREKLRAQSSTTATTAAPRAAKEPGTKGVSP